MERPGAQAWVPETGGLRTLRESAHDCRGCELWRGATQVVTSTGSARARIMLVGEQPGDHEDQEGEPFVGPAGRVLADARRAAGLDDRDVYTTNAVKHFRFEIRGKRRIHEKPTIAHIVACRPWLSRELDIVNPEVVVCLGATAARAVLGRNVTIGAERGRLLHEGGRIVIVTAHPSALLRLRDRVTREAAVAALVSDLRLARETAARGTQSSPRTAASS
jgi:uracil-DNA glycosylase family protein